MIYLILGNNSRLALKKIAEVKSVFLRKGGHANLIIDVDGEETSQEEINSAINQISMFGGKRLVIFKNVFEAKPDTFSVFKTDFPELKSSSDVFFFWEKELPKNSEPFSFFEKCAEKIQELPAVSAPSKKEKEFGGQEVFRFVDDMLAGVPARRWLCFKKALRTGIEPGRLIYALLWKLKQKRMADAYFECIKAESQMKRNPKNAEAILEGFILKGGKDGI